MYSVSIEDSGIVCTEVTDFLTPEQADQYVREVISAANHVRARYGRLRLLTIARVDVVLSSEATERFAPLPALLYETDQDRGAMIVRTNLGKMQAKRLTAGGNTEIFDDEDEARRWLTE